MFKKTLGCLVAICLPLIFIGNSWADIPTPPSDCPGGCDRYLRTPSTDTPPSRDYEAERRAQEAAAAEAEAQRQREAELERQRVEAENKRRMEEIARQAKFIDDRDAVAGTLRGSTGSTTSGGLGNSGLRGSSAATGGPGESGLRGSSATTELRGFRPATAQTPISDSMVVDARNVPTGLPKAVADSIPPTPAGDRVRKGFEAITEHDWKVALAWFQDALNHDPGNAGIQRLIDLAEFTMKRAKHPHPSVPHAKSVADTTAQDKATLTAADKQMDNRMDADLAKAFDDFNRNYLPKHPELQKPGKSSEQNTNWKPFIDSLLKIAPRQSSVPIIRN